MPSGNVSANQIESNWQPYPIYLNLQFTVFSMFLVFFLPVLWQIQLIFVF